MTHVVLPSIAVPDEAKAMALAKELTRLRGDLGWTIAEAERRTGTPRSTIARLESRGYRGSNASSALKYREMLLASQRGGSTPEEAVRGLITSVGEKPSDLLIEFGAKIAPLPIEEQWQLAKAFAVTLEWLVTREQRGGTPGGPTKEE